MGPTESWGGHETPRSEKGFGEPRYSSVPGRDDLGRLGTNARLGLGSRLVALVGSGAQQVPESALTTMFDLEMRKLERQLADEFGQFKFVAYCERDPARREPVITVDVVPRHGGERLHFGTDLGIYEVPRLVEAIRFDLNSRQQNAKSPASR